MNEPGNGTEKATAPMLPGRLTKVFSRVSYRHPFRRYQAQALEAFEKARGEDTFAVTTQMHTLWT